MTGSNVLDKSAMATLARLETELPHIANSLEEIAVAQRESVKAIQSLCKDVAVVTAKVQRNTDDIREQKQEARDRDKRIGGIQDDVAGLKATDRIIGGANALWAAIAAALAAIFGGN